MSRRRLPFSLSSLKLELESTENLNVLMERPVPSTSLWRHSLQSRARSGTPKELEVDTHKIELSNVSSFATHLTEAYCAIGHSAQQKDSITITKMDKNAKVVGKIDTGNSGSCDMYWSDDCLLVAHTDETVSLYKINPVTFVEKDIQKVVNSKTTFNYVDEKISTGASLRRLTRVKRHPFNKNQIISLYAQDMVIWDTNKKDTNLVQRVTREPNLALECSPHCSYQIVVGGQHQSLNLVDQRLIGSQNQAITWRKTEAHDGSILDIKWSPFVPHWIASAGDDAVIHLWDIRFGDKPVLSLQDHTNSVNRVLWSNSHADILFSAGADRVLKLWSACLEPHHILGSVEFTGSVVGGNQGLHTADSPAGVNRLGGVYGVCRSGTFKSVKMTSKFLQPLVSDRTRGDGAEETLAVEESIFFRDFSKAFTQALKLAEKYKEQREFEQSLEILSICSELPLADPEAKTITTSKTPQEVFQEDLSNYSYFIPPKFPLDLCVPAEESVLIKIRKLKVNLELYKYVSDGNSEKVLERYKDIKDALSNDIASIPSELLQKALQSIMSHDYLKGLSMVEELSSMFRGKNWKDFVPVVRTVLYPTLYDTLSTSQHVIPSQLFSQLMKEEACLKQIVFMRKFTQLLWSPNPTESESLLEFVDKNRPEPAILSLSIVRLYLNCLIQKNKFCEFYYELGNLLKVTSGFESYDLLNKMKKETSADIQIYFQQCQDSKTRSAKYKDKPWEEVAMLADAVVTCLTLLQRNYQILPQNLLSLLPPTLNLDLENSLVLLSKSKASKGGKNVTSKICKSLLSELEEIAEEGPRKEWKRQYNDLLVILKGFV